MRVDYVDHMGSDLTVANAARVSFDKHKAEFDESDSKLIGFLARNNHWTPFAHPQVTLRMTAPVWLRTQLFKHKVGFTENEVSRRYVDDEPEFFFPVLRQRPDNGAKQGSKNEFPVRLELCEQVVLMAHSTALRAYNLLIQEGVAPEQARGVLPQNMMTSWYWTGSLSAYARMCKLRLDPHAQVEAQQIAQKVSDIIKPLFPISWSVLVE